MSTDNWSIIYDTPVKRLLFLCGFRIDRTATDGTVIWRGAGERSSGIEPKKGAVI